MKIKYISVLLGASLLGAQPSFGTENLIHGDALQEALSSTRAWRSSANIMDVKQEKPTANSTMQSSQDLPATEIIFVPVMRVLGQVAPRLVPYAPAAINAARDWGIKVSSGRPSVVDWARRTYNQHKNNHR